MNISKRGASADVGLALLSGALYLSLRFALHSMIARQGYTDGGLVSYDSYYPFAFVEELQRTHHAFFFQNPFGTLDKEPYLFNLYASFLSLFRPFYVGNLFLFDSIFGAFFVTLGSFFLCRLMTPLAAAYKGLILFGGGVGFIGIFLGLIPAEDGLAGSYWGLTYLLNQIATPEILYHSLFFVGLFCLLRERDLGVIAVIAILTFLHPFTAITFQVTVLLAWIFALARTHRMINHRFRLALCAIASACTSLFLFQLLLPSLSQDAAYFKRVYEAEHFFLDLSTYAIFLLLPISYLLGSWLLFRSSPSLLEPEERLWLFLGTSLFCIFMGASYLFTEKIVQPAHWSRVYPHALIFASGALYASRPCAPSLRRTWKVITLSILAVALVDSAFEIRLVSNALFAEKRPPLFLTPDQTKIIGKARGISGGRFFYFRDCANNALFGDFEYALMALSPQKGYFGHAFFSPFLTFFYPVSNVCGKPSPLPKDIVQQTTYFILDSSLVNTFAFPLGETLYHGKTLMLFRNPGHGSMPLHENSTEEGASGSPPLWRASQRDSLPGQATGGETQLKELHRRR